MEKYEQLSPVDMTGIFETDVVVLRTAMMSVKGFLQPIVDLKINGGEPTLEMCLDAFTLACEEIDGALIRSPV